MGDSDRHLGHLHDLVHAMFHLLRLFSKTVSLENDPLSLSISGTALDPRTRHSYHHHRKVSERGARRIDILAREQDPYLRPSLSSLAFDGPYAESMQSSMEDHHQRMSIRTMSSVPELQVRRLSEQDWPHFAMQSVHAGLPSLLSHSPSQSTTSTRPL